ncbi:MAG: nucleotidyltransferase family protein [bacterium]|nr:nucleotidyltransferase family protein [bacterium]
MDKNFIIRGIAEKIKPILLAGGVKRSAIFGSFARGEEMENSDIDMLVELEGGKSLLDLVDLQFQLEKILGRPVDLITFKALHPLLRENVAKEMVFIF